MFGNCLIKRKIKYCKLIKKSVNQKYPDAFSIDRKRERVYCISCEYARQVAAAERHLVRAASAKRVQLLLKVGNAQVRFSCSRLLRTFDKCIILISAFVTLLTMED